MSYEAPQTVKWEYRLQRLGFIAFVMIAVSAALGYLDDRTQLVAKSAAIYLLLLAIFRIAGRRTLAETSTFDLVLLLIIGETTQQAMVGSDDSVLSAAVAIFTLVSLDMGIHYLRKIFPAFDHFIEGRPVLLIRDGQIQEFALTANNLDQEDIKEAARLSHGLETMEDVRQATLERGGKISIVPWRRDER